MKLHLGCGSVIMPGFLNIDVADICHTEYLKYDLSSGLPKSIEDNSVDFIYSSHFLEHMTNYSASIILNDCYRVMAPGGVIKLCLPDITECMQAWLAKDTAYFRHINPSVFGIESRYLTWISYMEYASHQNGEHVTMWDKEKARIYLENAGFSNFSVRDPEDVDGYNPTRLAYSFFVEATK